MVKSATRPFSRYSHDAVALLGQLVRRSRIERKITVAELAERAGLSRGLVQRIEATLSGALGANAAIMTLLPRSVRSPVPKAKDDF